MITSGGDRIYPKGFSVGTVIAATPDRDNDPFLAIKIKPAADLNRLEEVLVITEMSDNSRSASSGPEPMRAADILSQRLPSVPKVDPNAPKTPGGAQTGVPAAKPSPSPATANKPVSPGTEQKTAAASGSAKPPTATGVQPLELRRRIQLPTKPERRRKNRHLGRLSRPLDRQRLLRPSRNLRHRPLELRPRTRSLAKREQKRKSLHPDRTQSPTASAETTTAKPKPYAEESQDSCACS